MAVNITYPQTNLSTGATTAIKAKTIAQTFLAMVNSASGKNTAVFQAVVGAINGGASPDNLISLVDQQSNLVGIEVRDGDMVVDLSESNYDVTTGALSANTETAYISETSAGLGLLGADRAVGFYGFGNLTSNPQVFVVRTRATNATGKITGQVFMPPAYEGNQAVVQWMNNPAVFNPGASFVVTVESIGTQSERIWPFFITATTNPLLGTA